MTVKEIRAMDPNAIQRMTRKDLVKVANVLASAANKRIRRLKSAKATDSPAYQKVKATNRGRFRFSTRGKNVNQLREMVTASTKFMGMKTSTVRGFKSVRRKTYQRLGITGEKGHKLSKAAEKRFWEAYRMAEETHPTYLLSYGSNQLQSDLSSFAASTVNGHHKPTVEEINQRANEILVNSYLEMEEKYSDEHGGDDVFSLGKKF